jgi:hypothetical protein
MTSLYWFALVVGAGMYVVSLLADLGDSDVGGAADHANGVDGFQILSLRTATYFLFAFGVSGVTLTWLWGGTRGLVTALVSLGLGVLGAGLSGSVFRWLSRSSSGELPGDLTWGGTAGRVIIPLSQGTTGKILVTRGEREHELLARPFDPSAASPERWSSVIVVEMQHGVALVAPDDSTLHDPERLLPGTPQED